MWYRTVAVKRVAPRRGLIVLVLGSLFLLLFQFGPLKGSVPTLLLSASLQIGLMGYLVCRKLGLLTSPEPLTCLVTVITSGLMPLILLGAVFRFLGIAIPVFILSTHVLMLLLTFFPAPTGAPHLEFTRQSVFAYITVGVCIVALEGFGIANSQYRFAGEFSDRGLFASLTESFSNGGNDAGRYTRIVGQSSEFRLQLDGWTYASSAWVYGSGFPAYAYIWYLQTPLLIWTIPVALFVLAYQLTLSKWAATTTVIVMTVIAIQTYDVAFYEAFVGLAGRHPIFDLRTLREISFAVLLPFALFAWIAYLRQRLWRWLFLSCLSLIALAVVHPRADLLFILLVATSGCITLVSRRKQRINKRALLILSVVPLLGMLMGVFLLRTRLPDFFSTNTETLSCTPSTLPVVDMKIVHIFELPGIGLTYFLIPNIPAVVVIFVCSISLAVAWRHQIAGTFFLSPSIILAAVILSPPLIHIAAKLLSLNLLIGDPCQLNNIFVSNLLDNLLGASVVNIVTPMLIGCSLWGLLSHWQWLKQHVSIIYPVVTVGFLFLTIFEPIPIPESARDQVQTMQDTLAHLAVLPADVRFADDIQRFVDTGHVQIILAPQAVAGTVIEQVPNALVVTEAPGIYQAQANRFFTVNGPIAPFLDALDIAFFREVNIGYVIVRLFDTRYPQLLLDSERFEPLYSAYGYALFRVKGLESPSNTDNLFTQMNQLFEQQYPSAWAQNGLSEFPFVPLTSSPSLVTAWNELVPTSLTIYGLAFLDMMRGDFAAAEPLWETLSGQSPMMVEALALSLDHTNRENDALVSLLNALTLSDPGASLSAARALLTERYFYRLSSDDIQRVLAVIAQHEADWRQLTREDFSGTHQRRIELLMSRGFWTTAAEWLDWIPELEIRADEYAMRGLALLAQGKVSAALNELEAATEPDWLLPRVRLHPDRWEVNVAAQLYDTISGNLAERAGQRQQAEAFYRKAIADGAIWAGRYFLAHLTGDTQGMTDLQKQWQEDYATPLPEFVSLLKIAETGSIYVNQPEVVRSASESSFQVYATFGTAFERQYPIEKWLIDLRSPDSQVIYAHAEKEAHFVAGALLRVPIDVQIDPQMPTLTPALVILQAWHNNAVIQGETHTSLVLQRPLKTEAPLDAIPIEAHFGDSIVLKSYQLTENANEIQVGLYWQTDQPIEQDYHISLQVLDTNNAIVAQHDSVPLNGRYPTNEWRLHTIIEDKHIVPLAGILPQGCYRVALIVYSLADGARLPVTSENTAGSFQLLGSFER